jgi:hypothetical protein
MEVIAGLVSVVILILAVAFAFVGGDDMNDGHGGM